MRAFLTAILAGLITAGVATVASAAPEDDGLRLEAAVTYHLQPADKRVHVSIDIAATNQLPDQGSAFYYFDEVWVPAPAEASNIRAVRVGGGSLRTSVEETDDPQWSILTVHLSSRLLYRQTHEIELSYDLPDLPPRTDGLTRANEAYASFVVYPVGSSGSSDVQVIIPDGYHVDIAGRELEESTEDGSTVYRATDIADPEDWWAAMVARNDDLLERRDVWFGGNQALLRYFPGDDEWADFAETHLIDGVPVLEELIGLPWPVPDELQVVESATPHLYGWGGWYDSADQVIEVGEQLDSVIVLHELSHAWFNHEFTSELWLMEGLADVYASLAVERIGDIGTAPAAEPVSRSDDAALPLVDWTETGAGNGGEPSEADEYAYAASWWLATEVIDEIGLDAMAGVLEAAAGHRIPYLGDPEPETIHGAVDWRRLLDLLEEAGESTRAAELFEEYVVTPEGVEAMSDRDEARQVYDDLVAAGQGWTAPLELRRAMSFWRFANVDDLAVAAAEVLAHRDDVLAVTDVLGAADLPALEESYETAGDVADVVSEAERYADVARTLEVAQDEPGAAMTVLRRVGLVGSDLDGELRSAAAALRAGDVDEAERLAGEGAELAEGAPLSGAVRYALFGEVLLSAGLAWQLGRRRVGSQAWSISGLSSSRSLP